MMATVIAPSSGRMRLLGRDRGAYGQRRQLRRRLGYLPQNLGYYPAFTVVEFVEYFALLKEMPPARIPAAVAAAVERVDLGGKAKAKLRTLSGGMLRRVGIAQAIVNDPERRSPPGSRPGPGRGRFAATPRTWLRRPLVRAGCGREPRWRLPSAGCWRCSCASWPSLYAVTAYQATWGGPPLWPVAVGAAELTAACAVGFAAGVFVPSRFTAPLDAVGSYLVVMVTFRQAPGATGGYALLSPMTSVPNGDAGVFYRFPDLSR